MNVQEKILHLRKNGWTQEQICTRTGISQSSVSKIENGEQRDVSYSKGLALDLLIQEITTNQSTQIKKA